MPRKAPDPSIILPARPAGKTLSAWLYDAIRLSILNGRLRRGARLPATRDLSTEYGISRRVVVNVYEQLAEEGYLTSRVGAGTVVSEQVPEDFAVVSTAAPRPPAKVRQPQPLQRPTRAFRPIDPALDEFPMAIWTRIAASVLRRMSVRSLAGGEAAGLPELREQIAAYLATSRGVACSAEQIVVVSGTQQSLDLLARLVLQQGDPIWVEDPAYVGAVDAFRNAGARIVPVNVDAHGLNPAEGMRSCPKPKAVYLTPAHQFGLGTTLSLERKFELLRWAKTQGVVLIEDDYDSEFRFSGKPVPAMKGLDGGDSIFLLGSFNKALFPSLRLGYMVVPDAWLDRVLALRFQSDRYPPAIPQAILARFLAEGHFGRHLRRMRELYGTRRTALACDVRRFMHGAMELPDIAAGLNSPAYLRNGMSARQTSARLLEHGIEGWPLDQFALQRKDLNALLLGFAAFTEREIREGVLKMAQALGV